MPPSFRTFPAVWSAGSFSYRIPTSSGMHTVVLTFVEPKLRPGDRIFSILANGQTIVSDLDVAKAAGRSLTAHQQRFEVTAKDGVIHLEFKPAKGEAIVSAIEVQ